jgi:hypothetical protein
MTHTKWYLRAVLFALVLGLSLSATFLFLVSIAQADPETWYLRSGTGSACGPGEQESLNLSTGSSAVTKVLDGTGDTWNRVELTTRSIAPGDWQVLFDTTLGIGLGPSNRIAVLVERRDGNCTVQQTIIDQEVTITELLPSEYATASTNPGQVDFNAGDILTVSFSQTSGNQTVSLHYAGSLGSNADSRLLHPDTLVVVPVSNTTDVIESIQAFLGIEASETTDLTETVKVSLGISTSESASLGESVFSGVSASPSSTSSIQESVTSVVQRFSSNDFLEATSLVEITRAALGVGHLDTSTLQESVTFVVQRFNSTDFLETNSLVETTRAALGVGRSDTSTLQESVTFVVLRADSRGDDDDGSDSSFPPGAPGTDEEVISTPSQESDIALEPLGANLVRLWHFDNTAKEWSFYDPSPTFATVNAITEIVPMQAYWIRVEQDQIVVLNGRERFLFAGWNLIGW